MKNNTYRELKKFLDSLNDEQLDQEITIEVVEYKTFKNLHSTITNEDYVYDGYGSSPLSSFDKDYIFEEQPEVITKKGTVILSVDN